MSYRLLIANRKRPLRGGNGHDILLFALSRWDPEGARCQTGPSMDIHAIHGLWKTVFGLEMTFFGPPGIGRRGKLTGHRIDELLKPN